MSVHLSRLNPLLSLRRRPSAIQRDVDVPSASGRRRDNFATRNLTCRSCVIDGVEGKTIERVIVRHVPASRGGISTAVSRAAARHGGETIYRWGCPSIVVPNRRRAPRLIISHRGIIMAVRFGDYLPSRPGTIGRWTTDRRLHRPPSPGNDNQSFYSLISPLLP